MDSEKTIKVARLDGYLTGLVSLNGHINEYYAGAFLLDTHEDETLKSSLKEFFEPDSQVESFNNHERINLRQLEFDIQELIINNLLGEQARIDESKSLVERKKYLAFKIMDMIYFVICETDSKAITNEENLVHKIKAKFTDTIANFIFYCIRFKDGFLVLQFMRPNTSATVIPPINNKNKQLS